MLESARRERGAALMGVVNATPDSFFDGGRYVSPEAQRQRVDQLVEQLADVIDIGAESSRPGSTPVSAAEQIDRMRGVVRHAVGLDRPLVSIDTTNPEVADHMLSLGAHVINDVSCLADDELARVVAEHSACLVIMHARGPMSQMPGFSAVPETAYGDVVADVRAEWEAARQRALAAGLSPEAILFDPGLGFNKSARHSMELLRRLDELQALGVPMVVGASRKSFIAAADGTPPEDRLGGSIAAAIVAAQKGASMLRVHDVAETRQALAVAHAAQTGGGP